MVSEIGKSQHQASTAFSLAFPDSGFHHFKYVWQALCVFKAGIEVFLWFEIFWGHFYYFSSWVIRLITNNARMRVDVK